MRFERVRSLCIPCAAVALGVACAAALGDEVNDRSKDANLWAAPGGDQSLTRHSASAAMRSGGAPSLFCCSFRGMGIGLGVAIKSGLLRKS